MNYKTQISNILQENDGMVTNALLREQDIPTIYLTRMVKKGELTRIRRGIYINEHGDYDELALFQAQYPKTIFSYETALYLHGMIDKLPQELHVNVPAHYKFNQKPAHVIAHYIDNKKQQAAIMSVETIFGNEVAVTNLARTICDLIRHPDSVEPEVYGKALRHYAKHEDIYKLYQMAKIFNIVSDVHRIMEVLR